MQELNEWWQEWEELSKTAGENFDRDGEIMMRLDVERTEGLQQIISMSLVDTQKYTKIDGTQYDIPRLCGIDVPEDSEELARIQFSKERDPSLVMREDEEWGEVYAPMKEIEQAWAAVENYVAEIERNQLDVKEHIPQISYTRTGPIHLSVHDHGKYWNRFEHDPEKKLRDHYHTTQKKEGKRPKLEFMTGKTIIFLDLTAEQ